MTTAAAPPGGIGALLDEELVLRVSPDEAETLLDYAEHRENGLAAAREGRLGDAWTALRRARALAQGTQLSGGTGMLATALLEPAEAYVEYRRGRFGRARGLLVHAASLDATLTRDHGYTFTGAHRLQIAHNLVRVDRRAGEESRAVELGAALLDYLELRVERVRWALVPPRDDLDVVPRELLEHYFEEIASEVAAIMSGRHDASAVRLFEPLRVHAGDASTCDGHFAPDAHAWLAMKALVFEGDAACAAAAAGELIERGPARAAFRAAALDEVAALRAAPLEPAAVRLRR